MMLHSNVWSCRYRYRYFEGGVSSVYLWDLDYGFAGVILIKKAGDGSNKIKGCWDSIHVVEVQVCLLTYTPYCVNFPHCSSSSVFCLALPSARVLC